MADPLADADRLIEVFLDLHTRIRAAVIAGPPGPFLDEPGINPKGDTQAWFDVVAHRLAVETLSNSLHSGQLLSEEHAEPITIGPGGPVMVIDPVDGSNNAKRSLPPSAFAISAFAPDAPLHPENALVSLVGPIQEGPPIVAVKGKGARRYGSTEPLRCSEPADLASAFVSVEHPEHLAKTHPSPLSAFGSIRSLGSAATSICLVGTGSFHAHIDVRGTLTPENYLSSGHIVLEAGGVIVDPGGGPVEPVDSLVDGRAIIAAGTLRTAEMIVQAIN